MWYGIMSSSELYGTLGAVWMWVNVTVIKSNADNLAAALSQPTYVETPDHSNRITKPLGCLACLPFLFHLGQLREKVKKLCTPPSSFSWNTALCLASTHKLLFLEQQHGNQQSLLFVQGVHTLWSTTAKYQHLRLHKTIKLAHFQSISGLLFARFCARPFVLYNKGFKRGTSKILYILSIFWI